ncbi:GGDEF domain-containing protein [Thiococcus pfennigii]|uniref:GGDEF domain-containing protein n=1 Tax=Thiococcus pfennigii TaxID=1057 RepID=UPI0019064447|nr:GGDEF domain-containing protein [Thiococcus pfennigii]MBK1699930.1 diguanylate cyclase [Thiococcus pfennigii]MBK1731009.1 diguanylate cyclase [Thiococcus pfennigii]
MNGSETAEFRRALEDFALASGHLVAIELDATGRIQDYNKGFSLAVSAAGEPRGQSLAAFFPPRKGNPQEIVPGLPGGLAVPYRLVSWDGRELLLHAYRLADEHVLLLGMPLNPDESLAMQRMAGLTTEMGNLVRELRRANRRILDLARTDALTGLPNRRYFFERLGEALEQARQLRRPLSVLMIDLDHFKEVNDRFGHAGGDAVLTAFAELLRGGARASDFPGRLGGEELALLLPDTDAGQGQRVAERLRADTARLRPLGEAAVFTVSIGVATLRAEETGDAFLARADAALYAAKTAGRDRVVVAGAVSSTPAEGSERRRPKHRLLQ